MIKAAAVVVALISPVHSWYPSKCCSGKDCSAIDESRVEVMSNGSYLIDGRWSVAASQAQVSPDDEYHACITGSSITCFWVPKGTV